MKDPLSEGRQNSGTALPAAARRSRALTLTTLGAASLSGGLRRSPETVVFGPGKPLALLAYLHSPMVLPLRGGGRVGRRQLLFENVQCSMINLQ